MTVFIFRIAVRVVDADADDFFRRRDWRLPSDCVARKIRLEASGIFGDTQQRAVGNNLTQRRIAFTEPCREVDDPILGDKSVMRFAIDHECRKTRVVHAVILATICVGLFGINRR